MATHVNLGSSAALTREMPPLCCHNALPVEGVSAFWSLPSEPRYSSAARSPLSTCAPCVAAGAGGWRGQPHLLCPVAAPQRHQGKLSRAAADVTCMLGWEADSAQAQGCPLSWAGGALPRMLRRHQRQRLTHAWSFVCVPAQVPVMQSDLSFSLLYGSNLPEALIRAVPALLAEFPAGLLTPAGKWHCVGGPFPPPSPVGRLRPLSVISPSSEACWPRPWPLHCRPIAARRHGGCESKLCRAGAPAGERAVPQLHKRLLPRIRDLGICGGDDGGRWVPLPLMSDHRTDTTHRMHAGIRLAWC